MIKFTQLEKSNFIIYIFGYISLIVYILSLSDSTTDEWEHSSE
jgi:hypothetical protein